MLRSILLITGAAAALGCGSSNDTGGSTPDYGQRNLGSLDENCESVTGLTGRMILDQQTDQIMSTLGYVTASGAAVSPTELQVTLTWPADPVAICYPAHEGSGPRLAIEGVVMTFHTADGKFDESLSAKGWLPVLNGTVQSPQVVAVTTRGKLQGSWEPFPEYSIQSGTTMGFISRLAGANTASLGGNVMATASPAAELDAGIFQGGFAMAIWPTAIP